jgi:hypothetical protein
MNIWKNQALSFYLGWRFFQSYYELAVAFEQPDSDTTLLEKLDTLGNP